MHRFFLFIIPFLLPATMLRANIIYVNQNANGNNDGSSWEDAYPDLHDALDTAQPGDSVWVVQGTYYPTQGVNRSTYFELRDGIALFGGFSGTEINLSERDWEQNPTVLDGDIGVVGDSTDNSYTLLYIGTSDTTTIVDGLVFRHGNADSTGFGNVFLRARSGGALYIDGLNSYAYPKVMNCRFEDNASAYHGGAVLIYGLNGSVAPQFINCEFIGNRAGFDGGAIRKEGSSWIDMAKDFYGCTFSYNKAGRFGGGVYFIETDREDAVDFTGCDFTGNEAENLGGGIMLYTGTSAGSNINILDCQFYGNKSSEGAAVYLSTESFLEVESINVENCTFENNEAASSIFYVVALGSFQGTSTIGMSGCSFIGNTGGAVELEAIGFASFHIERTTVQDNITNRLFGMFEINEVRFQNCYIKNNSFSFEGTTLIRGINIGKIELVNTVVVDNLVYEGGLIVHQGNGGNLDLVSGCILGNMLDTTSNSNPSNRNLQISNTIILEDENYSNLKTLQYDSIFLQNTLITSPGCDSLPDNIICGTGNLFDLDPLFLDIAAGDYRLHPCSPARNAGDNNIVNQLGLLTDIDGAPRILEGTVDMGAYEMAAFDVMFSDVSPVDCYGESTGSAILDVQSGCGPYSISFSGASTFTDTMPYLLDGLPAGTFEFTVNDSEGRTEVLQLTIGSSPPLEATASATQVDCNAGTFANAVASIAGGTPFGSDTYNILWSDGTAESTANLPTGDHTLQITDSLGCIAVDSFFVEAIGELTVTVDSTAITCADSNDGTISVAPNGLPPYQWLWQDGQVTGTVSNLSPGTYAATITDTLGCSGSVTVVLTAPDSIELSIEGPLVVCPGTMDADLEAVAAGGTPPYIFLWGNGEMDSILTGIGAGLYSMALTDNNGCQVLSEVEISENTMVFLDTLIQHATGQLEQDGAIYLDNIGGGVPPYSYLWETGDTTEALENIPPGEYLLTVTDSLGCETVFTFLVDFQVATRGPGAGYISKLYPNPVGTGQKFIFSFYGGFPPRARIYLTDAMGRKAWLETAAKEVTSNLIEMSSPPVPGVYWLVVESLEGQKRFHKLVVHGE